MATLAFFPWIAVDQPATAGEFRLLPYLRGRLPASEDPALQEQVDAVLAPYLSATGRPIRDAVVIQLEDSALTADLAAGEAATLFTFAELLAFSGLSAREFFDHRYSSRDTFTLVVQDFRPESRAVARVTPRRDGSTHSLITAEAYHVRCPWHVSLSRIDERELSFLRVLLRARELPAWDRYFEAISSFNLANTDRPDIGFATEAVLMIGAFQRLLDCRSGKEDQLAERFASTFRPTNTLAPANCSLESSDSNVTAAFRRRASVREGWIRDFYALRGHYAHGTLAPRYPSIWSAREHLLLGALAFPLLVKVMLRDAGKYELVEDDQLHIAAFERLACARHFENRDDFPQQGPFPWHQVLSEVRNRRMIERLYAAFGKAPEENDLPR